MPDDSRRSATDRILHSAIEVISDFGVRRFTVDELARRVGLSRVTIYRHFENKSEVLEAAMLHELRRFLAEIELAVATEQDGQERMIEVFVRMVSRLREHAVFPRLLRTEPELILPLLTTQAGPVMVTGRDFLVRIARGGEPEDPAAEASETLEIQAELLARMILSFVLMPESVVPLGTEAELRAYAELTVPMIVRSFATGARPR